MVILFAQLMVRIPVVRLAPVAVLIARIAINKLAQFALPFIVLFMVGMVHKKLYLPVELWFSSVFLLNHL